MAFQTPNLNPNQLALNAFAAAGAVLFGSAEYKKRMKDNDSLAQHVDRLAEMEAEVKQQFLQHTQTTQEVSNKSFIA